MICSSISFCNYRNISLETVSFSDGVNVLFGDNAQGKSNILEGIYFFARGRSFRGAREREMIRFGEKQAQLSLSFQKDSAQYPVTLEADLPHTGKKVLRRGGARLSGVREMIGSFRAVLFCPLHLSLVGGGPALRRSFLDIALSQLYPAYLDSLSRYNRILAQRNALIKSGVMGDMAVWEVYARQLAHLGADIAARRCAYMSKLEKYVADIFAGMTEGREAPRLTYQSGALPEDTSDAADIRSAGEERLFAALTGSIEREVRYGATLYGIHKDDISIRLNEREARSYASQGQQRSLALAMKLAEGEMAKTVGGEYPVFLLDDVLSELDGQRREFILRSLTGRQIIVTSCEPAYFDTGAADAVRLLHVQDGAILPS